MADQLKKLQLDMLRIQQAIYHQHGRVIIVFEGVDAAGKGGAIRKITENLDPRGYMVHPVGPPTEEEKGKHYLYRFWRDLPDPGQIAIFDRSWYGRVLVERVDKLIAPKDWKRAYKEINQFEAMLKHDGIHLIKIFLCISKAEQLKRFKEREKDPYKQWKMTKADYKARDKWAVYNRAFRDMLKKNRDVKWHMVETDDKDEARLEVLNLITHELKAYKKWMEGKAAT